MVELSVKEMGITFKHVSSRSAYLWINCFKSLLPNFELELPSHSPSPQQFLSHHLSKMFFKLLVLKWSYTFRYLLSKRQMVWYTFAMSLSRGWVGWQFLGLLSLIILEVSVQVQKLCRSRTNDLPRSSIHRSIIKNTLSDHPLPARTANEQICNYR